MDFYFSWDKITLVFNRFQLILNSPFKISFNYGICLYLNEDFDVFQLFYSLELFAIGFLGIEFSYFRKED
jgi:hypothetical protein